MKRIFILLLFFIIASSIYANGFYEYEWETSRRLIYDNLKDEIVYDDSESIIIEDSIAGQKCNVIFYFDEDSHLIAGAFNFFNDKRNQYITPVDLHIPIRNFKNINDILSKKYTNPEIVTDIDLDLGDISLDLSKHKYDLVFKWVTNKSVIVHLLGFDDYTKEYSHDILYKSHRFENELRKGENSKL